MGTATTHFSNQTANLESRYELVLLDLPGHGDAAVEASENYFEETLNHVITQIRNRGEGYIVGLSLGASLAIHCALKVPELVSGIVLTGYSPFIPEELREAMEKQYNYFMDIEENNVDIAKHFMMLHGDEWKRTLKNVIHTMTFNYPTATQEHIRNIKVPMLLLNGSNELHEVEAAAYIKKTNNNTKIGLIPNAGHTANIDQPELYNKILEDFLACDVRLNEEELADGKVISEG